MAAMSVAERAEAISRANQALQALHSNAATSRGQLGAARDQLNIVYSWRDRGPVWDAVAGLECIVLDVTASKA